MKRQNELEARTKRFKERQQMRNELHALLKEKARMEQELDKDNKLLYLLELAMEAKERGEEGIYIPGELAYLQGEFEELVAACEGGEPC